MAHADWFLRGPEKSVYCLACKGNTLFSGPVIFGWNISELIYVKIKEDIFIACFTSWRTISIYSVQNKRKKTYMVRVFARSVERNRTAPTSEVISFFAFIVLVSLSVDYSLFTCHRTFLQYEATSTLIRFRMPPFLIQRKRIQMSTSTLSFSTVHTQETDYRVHDVSVFENLRFRRFCLFTLIRKASVFESLHLGRRFRKPPFSWVKVSVFHRISVDDRRNAYKSMRFQTKTDQDGALYIAKICNLGVQSVNLAQCVFRVIRRKPLLTRTRTF